MDGSERRSQDRHDHSTTQTGWEPAGGLPYPEWQKPVQEALIELDENKFERRIAAAETAIFNRLRAIAGSSNHGAERQAIEDALALLRALKRDS